MYVVGDNIPSLTSELHIMNSFQRLQQRQKRKGNFTVKKPGKHYLCHVIKLNISDKSHWTHATLTRYDEMALYLCGLPAKTHQPYFEHLKKWKKKIRQIPVEGHHKIFHQHSSKLSKSSGASKRHDEWM